MKQNTFTLGELDTKQLRQIAEQIVAINKSIEDWNRSYADVAVYKAELDTASLAAAAALRSNPSRETARAAGEAKASADQLNALLQTLPAPDHCASIHRGQFPNAKVLAVELCDAICKALEKVHGESAAEDAKHAEALGLDRVESGRTKKIAEFWSVAKARTYPAASYFASEICS